MGKPVGAPGPDQVITQEQIALQLALQRQQVAMAEVRKANEELKLADMEVDYAKALVQGRAKQIQADTEEKGGDGEGPG